MNCWEVMKCEPSARETCPAYPSRGQDCWKVTGTKCGQGSLKMSNLREKIGHCRECYFYEGFANKC